MWTLEYLEYYYGIVFDKIYREEPQYNLRSRKPVPETGSFGRSVKRSRSKTGTPARKEDPNLAVADSLFKDYIASKAKKPSNTTEPSSRLTRAETTPNIVTHSQALVKQDRDSEQPQATQHRAQHIHNVPTEVILRGYHQEQQYLALYHYEMLAGRILEDYPRDPPVTQRKFKGDLRDPASLRPRPLTEEERKKVNSFAGGSNWIKITFENEEAAEIAIEKSPQEVSGFYVFAERYRSMPPTETKEVLASTYKKELERRRSRDSMGPAAGRRLEMAERRQQASTLPRSYTVPGRLGTDGLFSHVETPETESTFDTATVSSSQPSGVLGDSYKDSHESTEDSTHCRKIPTAKKIQLLPASDALMPKRSFSKKVLANVPIISFFTSDIIGSQVPRQDNGDFDWALASFYWKIMWWLDFWFSLCGGDLAGSEKMD